VDETQVRDMECAGGLTVTVFHLNGEA